MQQGYIATLLNSIGDGAALTNSTTPTSLLPAIAKPTLPANYLFAGKMFRVTASGRISTVVTTPGTLTLDLRFGSVAVFGSGAMTLNTTAQTNVHWLYEALLTVRAVGSGTSANVLGQGKWTSHAVIGSSAIGTAGAGSQLLAYNTAPAAGTGFDSTAANTVDLFATWSVANAANSITCHQFIIEDLN
jgi:hypothetical protein